MPGEVDWICQCADWLTHLYTSEYPSAVNLRPGGDHPDRAYVTKGSNAAICYLSICAIPTFGTTQVGAQPCRKEVIR
ncbi:MAG: hypothetical protein JOY82_16880 [Streptosporangiaceae bacterium]|nr:hypothetical protein [Streptosporangiaceae bacterium]